MFMDNNWDDDWDIIITEITIDTEDGPKKVSGPVLPKDKKIKQLCPTCKRGMTILRCQIHEKATGCAYCHYQTEHLNVGNMQ